MTTPTPNTPSAEALEQAKHAVSYAAEMSLKDEDYVEICPFKLKIWKEFLSALTAPIEKIEGLGFEAWLRTVCFQNPTPEAYDLAKCAWQYAQGRTQSAVDGDAPERYWLIEQPDLDDDDDYKVIHTTDLDVYPDAKVLGEYVLKQEAPPVTAPIEKVDGWLPIESAPKDGTRVLLYMNGGKQCVARTEHHPFEGPRWVIYGEMGKPDCWCLATNDIETAPTHWQPLPAPPSSQTRGG